MSAHKIVVSFLLIIETALASCAIMQDFTRDFLDRNDWLLHKIEQESEVSRLIVTFASCLLKF